jgi:hypothetical protein
MNIYLANRLIVLRLLCLATSLLAVSPAVAESIDVITANGTPISSLTREETADLFLGKRKMSIEGLPLIPLDVSDDGLRDLFYRTVADMSAVRVSAYWARLVFSAQGRPPRQLTVDEAKSLVQSQPGMVTYLRDGKNASFKILLNLH